MSFFAFLQTRPRLTGALTLAAAGGVVAYLGKRRLDRSCPKVTITELPQSSACRNLIASSEAVPRPAWGLDQPALLAAWSNDDDRKTRCIPSFIALQVEVPVSLLAGYRGSRTKNENENENEGEEDEGDAHHLMRNLFTAFLDARAQGPEARVLDKQVPPLSFTPGSLLFGDQAGLGAFLLGTWSTKRGLALQPRELGVEAREPSADFLSNRDAIRGSPVDAAGAVMYWNAHEGLVRAMDKAASYGLPWRLMEGGFQEYIVEKVSEETARVTYVTIESFNVHPEGQSTRDFKRPPWLLYELHVLYAQILWYKTLRQLRKVPHTVE
ncbi:uncharacterized protein ACLA_030210 [Aspergillus clavatus NRRL 1]|uniref:Uncharacterized protein n=1 Tax=Aspergillus clavatus (strain ATCC 1007 / CBS 513.65 / DSM 816 / NCTC 3887 / NRRL 1 / QM 1276 / 107) TaxID=344612 RepID=A1CRL7_ASPCL|nr:uncharacterized protein ACLA_030210 [Aspergillus clavatus NRRL 1]EAW08288.1 hypothetical protein ACLA_030210 [Aspergillus clavatus NRRL 1]